MGLMEGSLLTAFVVIAALLLVARNRYENRRHKGE